MSASRRRIEQLKATIPEVDPQLAYTHSLNGSILIDVRESDELSQGVATTASRLGRGFLELKVEQLVPDLGKPVIVMCASGVRSLFAAESLRQLGYDNVSSVRGGFNAWKRQGLPVHTPRLLNDDERERYGRHLSIPEVGEAGQIKLLQSKVLMIGAGGLGSPAAYYLAAAGVGTLGIVDDDVVDRSNLQRQILHTEERVGMPKVHSARKTLLALNSSIHIDDHMTRLDSENVESLFAGYDVIVDGTDNFTTRYLINDACVKLGIPNVHGSIFRFEGQVSVFWPGRKGAPGPCYRCLYPSPPPPELAPSCAEAGVLGVLPGVVGLLQAVETIKLLLGIGEPLVGRLLQYDALESRFTKLRLDRDPECDYCADGKPFPGYVDVAHSCGTAAAQGA